MPLSHDYRDDDGVRYCTRCKIAEAAASGFQCPDPRVGLNKSYVGDQPLLDDPPSLSLDESDSAPRHLLAPPKTIKVCADCGYTVWRDHYPCNRCGGINAATYVRTATVARVLGEYAVTTRKAQPRRVTPGEVVSRTMMEGPDDA